MTGASPSDEEKITPASAAPRRHFGLGDLMIATASLAAFLSLTSGDWPTIARKIRCIVDHVRGEIMTKYTPSLPDCGVILALGGFFVAIAGLFIITPTVLLLRLRQPRPPWRRLASEPGAVAGLAASAGIAGAALISACSGRFPIDYKSAGIEFAWIDSASAGVALAWIALRLGRRWHPPRDWVDQLGRVVGLGWLAFGTWILPFRVLDWLR
jgi:hypothetical protein